MNSLQREGQKEEVKMNEEEDKTNEENEKANEEEKASDHERTEENTASIEACSDGHPLKTAVLVD
jgi:hypothetical protein